MTTRQLIITDANIWIDHLRAPSPHLQTYLRRGVVRLHPYTIGEIALGSLKDRRILEDLKRIPACKTASHDEVMALIENGRLFGTGVGYVDCHLLASTRMMAGARLWTRDRRLRAQAERLEVLCLQGT